MFVAPSFSSLFLPKFKFVQLSFWTRRVIESHRRLCFFWLQCCLVWFFLQITYVRAYVHTVGAAFFSYVLHDPIQCNIFHACLAAACRDERTTFPPRHIASQPASHTAFELPLLFGEEEGSNQLPPPPLRLLLLLLLLLRRRLLLSRAWLLLLLLLRIRSFFFFAPCGFAQIGS